MPHIRPMTISRTRRKTRKYALLEMKQQIQITKAKNNFVTGFILWKTESPGI